jgi:hypothetical protein
MEKQEALVLSETDSRTWWVNLKKLEQIATEVDKDSLIVEVREIRREETTHEN